MKSYINNTLVVILCKKKSFYVDQLSTHLSKYIKCIIIQENKSLPIEYYGLNRIKKTPIAWENAFYTIKKDSLYFKYYWFIEDDVYSHNFDTFIDLFKFYDKFDSDLIASEIKNKDEAKDWYWWSDSQVISSLYTVKSFNPICRISISLLKHIELYRQTNKGFCFHEVLFPSICKQKGLTIIDYTNNDLIGSIQWKPITNKNEIKDNKIYHPVKIKC